LNFAEMAIQALHR